MIVLSETGAYLSSPGYSTSTTCLPGSKSEISTTALPSTIGTVWFSPSIVTVTLPVASSGTSMTNLPSSLVISIFGTLTVVELDTGAYLPSPG